MPSPTTSNAAQFFYWSALLLAIAASAGRVAAFASSPRQPCSLSPASNIFFDSRSRTGIITKHITNRSSKRHLPPPTALLESPSSAENETNTIIGQRQLPMLLDPGTRGGVLFLGLILFVVPLAVYQFVTLGLGVNEMDAGRYIGAGYAAVACSLWLCTTILRVINKDMTYAKQLKEYENAVLAKRMNELEEDELQALVEDLERDSF